MHCGSVWRLLMAAVIMGRIYEVGREIMGACGVLFPEEEEEEEEEEEAT